MKTHAKVDIAPSAWIAETSGYPRLVKSVYLDICMFNWAKAKPMPLSLYGMAMSDLPQEQSENILAALIDCGLVVSGDAGISSITALADGVRALTIHEAKTRGGQSRLGKGKPRKAEALAVEERMDDFEAAAKIVAATAKANELREKSSQSFKDAVNAWNAMAIRCGLSQVQQMSEKRKSGLKARIEDHGAEELIAAIDTIPASRFLIGNNDRKWKANFDWLLQPDSCAKLVEGVYHNEGDGHDGKPSGWRL